MTQTFFAQKVGMTSFHKDDQLVPITVLNLVETVVLNEKTDKEGTVRAALLGVGGKPSKPVLGTLKKNNVEVAKKASIRNIESSAPAGQPLDYSFLNDVKSVHVSAITIGKGFQGVMKRHNFGGLRASHGVSISHRSHGSTGGRQDPGKVFKNKKMAGHMGATRVTTKNLAVVFYDAEAGLLAVKGGVPGPKNGTVEIRVAQ